MRWFFAISGVFLCIMGVAADLLLGVIVGTFLFLPILWMTIIEWMEDDGVSS